MVATSLNWKTLGYLLKCQTVCGIERMEKNEIYGIPPNLPVEWTKDTNSFEKGQKVIEHVMNSF